jgi:hypothetical protein
MKTGLERLQRILPFSKSHFASGRCVLWLVIGLSCFAELSGWAKPRPPRPPWPEDSLTKWRFDGTDISGALRPTPLTALNIELVESWSGYALSMTGTKPRLLEYRLVENSGRTNLDLQNGSLRFWFRPDWTSGGLGGGGSGGYGRLVEAGDCTASADALCWSLFFTPDGNELRFGLQAGGRPVADCLQAPIAWQAGEWHLITLTYSSDGSVLFLDGERVGEGKGPPAWLVAAAGSESVFCIGGDASGDNLAQGQFDELATFGYPLTDTEVMRHYQKLWPTVRLGPVTPEEKQAEAAAWAMQTYLTPNDAKQQFPFGAAAYGCGLWLEISASNAVATLTLHNTRSGAGYQILTNADLTTTN